MDQFHLVSVFVAVVDTNGFAGAARKLNISPPAVTRAINELESHLGVPYCSKSPHASCGKSFVVIQDATKSRAATDGSIMALDDRTRRDQRIAQPLMIALEMMMRDILTQRTTQHPLPDRNQPR